MKQALQHLLLILSEYILLSYLFIIFFTVNVSLRIEFCLYQTLKSEISEQMLGTRTSKNNDFYYFILYILN